MKIKKNQGSNRWCPGNNVIFTLNIRRHYDNPYGNTVDDFKQIEKCTEKHNY